MTGLVPELAALPVDAGLDAKAPRSMAAVVG
jgi:hypothetical protein